MLKLFQVDIACFCMVRIVTLSYITSSPFLSGNFLFSSDETKKPDLPKVYFLRQPGCLNLNTKTRCFPPPAVGGIGLIGNHH
jgi:hypothetical protein